MGVPTQLYGLTHYRGRVEENVCWVLRQSWGLFALGFTQSQNRGRERLFLASLGFAALPIRAVCLFLNLPSR